jgi:hypothetical protein
MRARLRIVGLLGLGALGLSAGCERLLSLHDPVADRGDAGGSNDGGSSDGGLSPSSPILLSEIALAPTAGEMIEIVNTSTEPVDLSTYYLSDSANYYRLPVQASADPSDFVAKFPDGAMIGGHQVFTVAIDTAVSFSTVYGMSPTFSITDPDSMKVIVANAPTLTNGGEVIILFQWDGHSDLVRDVDIMIAGAAVSANSLADKSGKPQDGPDPDMQTSAYAADANTIKPQLAAPPTTPVQLSTKRLLLEDGHENQGANGNGQSGDDETSEDTSVTWDGTIANPFTPPNPGIVPAALLR